jgi:hypothetical protein
MITARNFSPQHAPDFSNFDEMDTEPLMPPRFEPNSYTSPTDRDNIPHRTARKVGSDEEKAIPKQSKQAARILFASIAPHVEFRTLHQLMKQLTKMLSRGQHHLIDKDDRAGKKRALKRRLGLLFDKNASQAGEYSWSVKSHPWIEPLLYQFLMGKFMEHPDAFQRNNDESKETVAALSKALSYQVDGSYPVNRNRAHFQKNVNILLRAREMCLEYPIFWTVKAMNESGYYGKTAIQKNKGKKKQMEDDVLKEIKKMHSEKTSNELTVDGERLLEWLIHKMPQPHFEKLMKELGKFAEVEGNLAEKKRESWYIESGDEDRSPSNWHKAVDDRPLKEIKPKETKQNKITVLGVTLDKISSSHSHIVAAELGRYFYAVGLPLRDASETPSACQTSGSDDNKQSAAEKTASSTWTPMRPQDVTAAIRKHRKLTDTEKKFEKLRTNFVERLVELQHEFASWEDTSDTDEENDEISDDSDNTSPELMVKEFQRDHINCKAGARKLQEEALAETLLELQKMGMRTDEDVKKRRGRRRKG